MVLKKIIYLYQQTSLCFTLLQLISQEIFNRLMMQLLKVHFPDLILVF